MENVIFIYCNIFPILVEFPMISQAFYCLLMLDYEWLIFSLRTQDAGSNGLLANQSLQWIDIYNIDSYSIVAKPRKMKYIYYNTSGEIKIEVHDSEVKNVSLILKWQRRVMDFIKESCHTTEKNNPVTLFLP